MSNILVVDDKDAMRKMLTETLVEEGHRVDAASSGKNAVVCGNIGEAFSGKVSAVKHDQVVVLEVSSFQLKRIENFKPRVALIANITQNHFDWHGDFSDYFASKMNIYRNQDKDDFCVLNYDDKSLRALGSKPRSRVYFYSINTPVKGAYLKGKSKPRR